MKSNGAAIQKRFDPSRGCCHGDNSEAGARTFSEPRERRPTSPSSAWKGGVQRYFEHIPTVREKVWMGKRILIFFKGLSNPKYKVA